MKTIIIDHDEMTVQRLISKLEEQGYEVFHEADKNVAVETLVKNDVDIILLDPAPMKSPRSISLNIRRAAGQYPYILFMSENTGQESVIDHGVNDFLPKPIDPDLLNAKLENAQRLRGLLNELTDKTQNFEVLDGLMPKYVLNQLFSSLLDRADRYAELGYILIIRYENFDAMCKAGKNKDARDICSVLGEQLNQLRRKSDIIGQIKDNEFALLLQRPSDPKEPVEAAARLAQSLSKAHDLQRFKGTEPYITLNLVEVPSGKILRSLSL